MAEQLSQMPKPDAKQYSESRKLLLVPLFLFPPNIPEDLKNHLERYWTEVRDHIHNLERSLGSVSHVYHEMLYTDGDDGIKQMEALNPEGGSFVNAICRSTATLESTEDRMALEESTDWQRCINMGLMSNKVRSAAFDGYEDATKRRYEHIASRIGDTLQRGEAGVLFISENHKVQFPTDIQVFYVAPPSLDAIKRWMSDALRPPPAPEPEAAEPEESNDDDTDDTLAAEAQDEVAAEQHEQASDGPDVVSDEPSEPEESSQGTSS